MKTIRHQIDDIDDVLDSIFEKEDTKKKQDVKVQVHQEPESPVAKFVPPKKKSDGKLGDVVSYFENYGKKYRAIIASISAIPKKPEPQFDGKFRSEIPDWLMPVFLCKNARKDVERSLEMQEKKPADYITPATENSQKKFGGGVAQDMRQGFIYCLHLATAKHSAYAGFFKRKEDDIDENRELFDGGKKLADEKSSTAVACDDCTFCKVLKVKPAYICMANVFATMKDLDTIDDKVPCSTFKQKANVEASNNGKN
jgi:hypothetical protein